MFILSNFYKVHKPFCITNLFPFFSLTHLAVDNNSCFSFFERKHFNRGNVSGVYDHLLFLEVWKAFQIPIAICLDI